MIKIAVCDDEKVMCEQLKRMTASKLEQWKENFRITCYTNALQLLYGPQDADLIFLDIQMPHLDGMDLAKRLRQKGFEGILIFVTVLKDCMPDAFEVEALDYLCKPVDELRLERTLQRSLKRLKRREERYLSVQTMNWCKNIRLKDIFYCEIINRKIYVHTENQIIEYYGKMKDVERQTEPDFIRCHRSFLINPEHLLEYRNAEAVLENGERVPVSRSYHQIFMKKMMDFMGKDG